MFVESMYEQRCKNEQETVLPLRSLYFSEWNMIYRNSYNRRYNLLNAIIEFIKHC